MKCLTPVLALCFLLTAAAVEAADAHVGRMETCMNAALARHPGRVISLEAEIEKGKPIYEFDIQGEDGKEWEVECDARSGKVLEEEHEVADANDPEFKAKSKITEAEARKTALERRPGEVVEVEYAIEADGNPSYEFDIKAPDGTEWEVEIDAVTGKVLEVEREVYQIGVD